MNAADLTSAYHVLSGKPPESGSILVREGALFVYHAHNRVWEALGSQESPVKAGEEPITLDLDGKAYVTGSLRRVLEVAVRAKLLVSGNRAEDFLNFVEKAFIEAGWSPPMPADALKGDAKVEILMDGATSAPYTEHLLTRSIEAVIAQAFAGSENLIVERVVSDARDGRHVTIVPMKRVRSIDIFQSKDEASCNRASE